MSSNDYGPKKAPRERLRDHGNFDLSQIDLEKYPECRDMPLVFYIAKRCLRIRHGRLRGLDMDDLLQIGYLALRSAHQLYDESKGPYERYAARSVNNALHDAINESYNLIHIPRPALYWLECLDKGKPVPGAESRRRLRSVKAANRARRMLQKSLDTALGVSRLGLDDAWVEREAIDAALARLPDTEQLVLRLYYGLDGDEPLNFRQIAKVWPRRAKTRQAVQYVHRDGLILMREILDGVA
jgi:RNA polymerase sigma factor (sigma-70 family)